MTEETILTKTLTDVALTRRSFLKWSAALGGTAALAGGLNFGLKTVEKAAAAGIEEVKTIGCYHNCGGRCILGAVVKDGTVTRLVPDPTKEETPGNPRAIPCVRGRAQTYRVYAPDRLKYPLKRVGKRGEGKFERISWDEALDTIANKMKEVKAKYGNEAFFVTHATGVYWTGPEMGRDPFQRMLYLFGGCTGYYGNYSSACYSAALPYITAKGGNSGDDLLNSNLIVLFAMNPMVTHIGGDNLGYILLRAKARGAKFIVVDPMMTDTVLTLGAEWVPINGGTDVAFIAAMANVMVKENLYDKEFMAKYTAGFDEDNLPEGAPRNSSWMAYIMGKQDGIEKTPEWASKITGIPASVIVRIAREIASVKPCALLQNLGWQRRAYGEQPVRALPILAAMSGNFALSGGGPGLNPSDMAFKMASMPPVPENPIKVKIPIFLWPDFITRGTEMTAEKDGLRGGDKIGANMKFLWHLGGNVTLNQHSDINGTAKMLEDDTKLEMIVDFNVSMTPSAKFADIVLPGTTGFETESLIVSNAGNHGCKGNRAWVVFNHRLVEPMYESKSSLWIAEQLADRLGIGDEFRDGHHSSEDWMREMVASAQQNYPDFPSYEEFREIGYYKVKAQKPIVAFKDFVEDPEANPLKTQTGKIEIYSPYFASLNDQGIPAIPKYIPEWEGVEDPLREKYPLLMSTTHWMSRSHSTFDNVAILREAHPQCLWINTLDAQARGIKNGDMVRVFNDRGEVHLPAYVTNRIIPGSTNMPQGAWYTPNAQGIDERGACNVLTKYQPTPFARGNPQHTNLVQVEKL
ncbi:MAG: hypothetical protein B6D40_04690 [Anaerolineae bacterium UTCFX3]|nr:MAG: hypothetical protein B6D40_04690 [Anaerolineae bacterium UTCFX3]